MLLDYNSLLVALAVSASCLAVIVLGSWFARRSETFLLTCSVGLVFVICGIFTYSFYITRLDLVTGVGTFVFLMIGFSVIWAAGGQFRRGQLSWRQVVAGSVVSLAITVPPMLAGYDGLAFMFQNTVIGLLLLATAWEYWLSRDEAPVPLYGIASLYALTALTFFLCAAVLVANGKLVLGHAPQGWAEDLSIAVAIAGMTGIGALSLALHQWRQAARHRVEANTDPLTGLLNRRALFDLYGDSRLGLTTAAIVFDIDHFKAVNDQYGHAVGDVFLRIFAEELSKGLKGWGVAARLGGEEFAIILDNTLPGSAEQIADAIRTSFALRSLPLEAGMLNCTVSAGVAFGSNEGTGFDGVLNSADKALYAAKRGGRNRVELADFLHAVPAETARSGFRAAARASSDNLVRSKGKTAG